jgi:hypothetical protein
VYFPSLIMGIGWCVCCGISMAFMVLMLGNVSVAPCSLCGGWSVGELAGRGWTHLGSIPFPSVSSISWALAVEWSGQNITC